MCGFQETLVGLQWLATDVDTWIACIYEFAPLTPIVNGYHDASGYMFEGAVLPGLSAGYTGPAVSAQNRHALSRPILCAFHHMTSEFSTRCC